MVEIPKRVLTITSGGNAPGVGRCIIDIAQCFEKHGTQVLGARYAGKRLMERLLDHDEIAQALNSGSSLSHNLSDCFVNVDPDLRHVEELYDRSGTFLGSYKGARATTEELAIFKENLERLGIEGIVVIGGNGSMGVFQQDFDKMGLDIPFICIGKTIDNDMPRVDFALGFWSAVEYNARVIRNVMTTAADHNGIFIIEIMGRDCPELGLHSALNAFDKNGNSYVDMLLGVDPEKPYDIESIEAGLRANHSRRAPVTGLGPYSVIVVPECMTGLNGEGLEIGRTHDNQKIMGSPAQYLAQLIKEKVSPEVLEPYCLGIRALEIGHTQRAADICDRDKALAYNLAEEVVKGFERGLGHHVILNNETGFTNIPLTQEFAAEVRPFDLDGHGRRMAWEKGISFGNEGAEFWRRPLHMKQGMPGVNGVPVVAFQR